MGNTDRPRPGVPDDGTGSAATSSAPQAKRRATEDPRTTQALDNIGVDDQANLLDTALDDSVGDVSGDGTSFADDVRSDDSNDEANERR